MILSCALVPPVRAQPSADQLPAVRDLAAAAEAAARGNRAMLVLFSEPGCPYCERVRRDFLLPMQRNEGYRAKLVFAEVDIHSEAAFARRYRIKLLPTVLLLGRGGEVLAEPLVGYNGPDFYGAYLDKRIDAALATIR